MSNRNGSNPVLVILSIVGGAAVLVVVLGWLLRGSLSGIMERIDLTGRRPWLAIIVFVLLVAATVALSRRRRA